ncbi:hypothetical protein [Desulfonatronovibrio magnus]|uniref:hypothetical protein n=1 Tax=Desulfonatronovibrio magnus TaxID=698827 RepID=UPI0012FA65EC|nr:hypothetical protein [Desulfonatronovibrio magnus]
MKRSPQEQQIIKCLGPSKFSATGFMGNDPREVEEVISDDANTLEKAGLDRQMAAHILEKIFHRAASAIGDPIEIADGVTAEYIACRGKIPSPFPGEGAFAKNMVQVYMDRETFFYINSLSIHLIRKHGFFQGTGSPFRIEPEWIITLARHVS